MHIINAIHTNNRLLLFIIKFWLFDQRIHEKKKKEMVDSGFRDSSYYDTINIESTFMMNIYKERRFYIE